MQLYNFVLFMVFHYLIIPTMVDYLWLKVILWFSVLILCVSGVWAEFLKLEKFSLGMHFMCQDVWQLAPMGAILHKLIFFSFSPYSISIVVLSCVWIDDWGFLTYVLLFFMFALEKVLSGVLPLLLHLDLYSCDLLIVCIISP